MCFRGKNSTIYQCLKNSNTADENQIPGFLVRLSASVPGKEVYLKISKIAPLLWLQFLYSNALVCILKEELNENELLQTFIEQEQSRSLSQLKIPKY